jgi:hypothetical protein
VSPAPATPTACAAVLMTGGVFGFLTHNQTLEAFRIMICEQEIRGLTRTGSGDSCTLSVSDHVSISYLGYAIEPLEAA